MPDFPDTGEQTTRILLLEASPRRGGSTSAVADIVESTLTASGFSLSRRSLSQHLFLGCSNCGMCGHPPHRCSQDPLDDTEQFLVPMKEAETLIWLSPVYFYGMPGQAKSLLDRTQRFWEATRERVGAPANEVPRGPRVYGMFIAGRTNGKELFTASRLALRYSAQALGGRLEAWYGLRGVDSPLDMDETREKEVERWAKELAQTLAK